MEGRTRYGLLDVQRPRKRNNGPAAAVRPTPTRSQRWVPSGTRVRTACTLRRQIQRSQTKANEIADRFADCSFQSRPGYLFNRKRLVLYSRPTQTGR